jgi:hypothetical protein
VEQPVEVAVFERGELRSVRTMSPERERRAALLGGFSGAALVLMAMAAAAGLLWASDQVVHAPKFLLAWFSVAGVVGVASARRAAGRMGRYRLGADIEADAFAMADLDLVRRSGGDYELALLPGMSGAVEAGRSSLPLEALTGRGAVRLPMPAEGRVRIDFGPSTFVIARGGEVPCVGAPFRGRTRWLTAGLARQLLRAAALGTPIAALATFFGSVPAAMAVTDHDARWAIPPTATPLQVEQLIRQKAQIQSFALHECFDPLPLSCQRAGYVGVGISLSPEGEILSHWISRSTYGQNCPVAACMDRVISGWAFEPMKERMSLVIPVQVLRSRKPLEAAETAVSVDSALRDAGTGYLDSDFVR